MSRSKSKRKATAPPPSKHQPPRKRPRLDVQTNDVAYASARLQPFSPAASGSKCPDSEQQQSMTLSDYWQPLVTVNADGNAAFSIRPRAYQSVLGSTVASDGTITWASSGVSPPSYGTLAANAMQYRLTGGGVRVSYVGPRDTTQGRLLWYAAPDNGGGSEAPANTSQWIRSGITRGMASVNNLMLRSIMIPFTQCRQVQACNYRVPAQTDNNGWNDLKFALLGLAPSTANLLFEVVYHYEWVPLASTQLSGTAAPRENPGLLTKVQNAATRALDAASSGIEGVASDPSVWQSAYRLVFGGAAEAPALVGLGAAGLYAGQRLRAIRHGEL